MLHSEQARGTLHDERKVIGAFIFGANHLIVKGNLLATKLKKKAIHSKSLSLSQRIG